MPYTFVSVTTFLQRNLKSLEAHTINHTKKIIYSQSKVMLNNTRFPPKMQSNKNAYGLTYLNRYEKFDKLNKSHWIPFLIRHYFYMRQQFSQIPFQSNLMLLLIFTFKGKSEFTPLPKINSKIWIGLYAGYRLQVGFSICIQGSPLKFTGFLKQVSPAYREAI